MAGSLSNRAIHPDAYGWWFEGKSALTFAKFAFQVFLMKIVPCFRCDLVMSTGERDFPNLLFFRIFFAPHLLLHYLWDGWSEFEENFTQRVKDPV